MRCGLAGSDWQTGRVDTGAADAVPARLVLKLADGADERLRGNADPTKAGAEENVWAAPRMRPIRFEVSDAVRAARARCIAALSQRRMKAAHDLICDGAVQFREACAHRRSTRVRAWEKNRRARPVPEPPS
ncbi:hypothetical protein [Lysobacter enzymogenes]|uniref:hypothetical protein n=1 Tax=Lysobacter enzymogenes TaxID=69 RepID=UPI001A96FF1D|nr:hypothetical protein [Lysobacter enzymogenes]QQP96639.1 hypothetical protein JHW38_00850 [Lysobacter enzymogenes]